MNGMPIISHDLLDVAMKQIV